jgi:predicted SAM-dependent methyltransferase
MTNYYINLSEEKQSMIIDIGSGPAPKNDANIKMDIHQWPGVNCLHNLLITPYPFETSTFDKAYMGDVLEHIYIFDVERVLNEVNRILKDGAILEITVPDFRWIAERIVKNDWNEKANVGWLNPTSDPWKNAMSYLFGGFHNKNEYKMQGMGHVNGFDYHSIKKLLEKTNFKNIERVADLRNPEPARDSILKIICIK